MNVFHAACALAGRDEWVPTTDVFFLVEANPANFARLMGSLDGICSPVLHQRHA